MALRRKKVDCDEILPWLFLGSAKASKDAEGLEGMGISHILNIAGKQHFPDRFVYKRSFFQDKSPISGEEEAGEEEGEERDEVISMEQLKEMFQFMDEINALP